MFQQKKPYSAVTVTIENLTSESYDEDDFSGIPELVDVISLQASGPTEAARAIRKKLKYGNVHRQLRALVLLDGLIQNAGPRFQQAFADEPLLERLRVCGNSDLSDAAVKAKCRELFRGWSQYSKTPGLERISKLHKELPKRKIGVTQERSKVIRETEENPFGDEEEEEAARAAREQRQGQTTSASSSSNKPPLLQYGRSPDMVETSGWGFKDKKKKDKNKDKGGGKRKKFDLETEKEQMKSVIADASMTSTTLVNALQSINRERERISDNQLVMQQFETCKQLRRRVLRYIQYVEHEQWLGGLLHANDELVHALMTFEQLDQSIDADSDSDDEIAEQAHLYRMVAQRGQADRGGAEKSTMASPPDISGLHLHAASTRPPRPTPAELESDSEDAASEEEDENDPFADSNIIHTPAVEQDGMRWR